MNAETEAHVDSHASILSLQHVGFRIGAYAIVDDVSLAFARGTLTTLIGPNGAGKSTLLGLAAGDLAPTSGLVTLAGKPIAHWRARELAGQRSVLPQDHAVRFAFGAREVVAMGRLPHPPDPERDARIVDAALAAADVVHLAERDVQTLSGGESARVAFARVLAQDTPLVFLDEPTAALDLHHQESVMRTARRLADDGACIVIVLHDLNLAAAYSDRIVMLAEGRIVADGTPRDVLRPDTIERIYHQRVQVIAHPSRDVPLVVVVD